MPSKPEYSSPIFTKGGTGMTAIGTPTGTAKVNGHLWGSSARDWASIQEGQFRAGFEAVLAHCGVGPGITYLDAGCGAGMAAQMAAGLGAGVSGFDAAESLLAIARERVPSGDFRVADLENVPFETDSFDVVTGFNSFQFAADPVRALGEAKRVARPGGKVVVMTWGDPEGMEAAAIVASLRPLLPPPPPGAPGPFALSAEPKLRAFAEAAGLVPQDVVDVASPWHYPDEATALRGLGSSGVAAKAAKLFGAEAVDVAHRAAIAPFQQADGSYRIGAACRFLVATA
jgi:SAM-dependent methyltransferase